MERKQSMLIINPKSGTRSKRGVEEYVKTRLDKMGYDIDVRVTGGAGDATEFAKEGVTGNYDLVIAAGGDGTVNETAQGLKGSDTPLAILPFGSGNGLARTLNIPGDLKFALDVIESGKVAVCDSGMVNGIDFFCTFGIGFDALVSEKFAQEKHRGRATYIKNTIREYLNYAPQHYALSIDGEVIVEEAFLIAVCNASQYGNNAYIAPGARLDDGLLDIIVIHSGSLLKNALMGVNLFSGQLDKNTLIQSFRTPSAVISRLSEGPVHLDGEPMIMGKKLAVKCHPACLKVIIPEKETDFRPFITPLRSMVNDIHYDLRALFGIR